MFATFTMNLYLLSGSRPLIMIGYVDQPKSHGPGSPFPIDVYCSPPTAHALSVIIGDSLSVVNVTLTALSLKRNADTMEIS